MWGRFCAALALTACNQLLGLTPTEPEDPPDAPSIPACLSDSFDDGVINSGTWSLVYPENDIVVVTEQGGVLELQIPSGQEHVYNGIRARGSYDMIGGHAQIELVAPPSQAGGAEAVFYIETDASLSFTFSNYAGRLMVEKQAGTDLDRQEVTFDMTRHRFWRFRHAMSSSTIEAETSADGTAWSLVRSMTLDGRSPTTILAGALAGAFDLSNPQPGTAKFDNIKIVSASCP